MDPGPLTLRQLLTRAEARQRDQWNHTAALLAELLNGPRTRKDKRPWSPAELHPLREPVPVQRIPATEFTQLLRSAFC